MRQPQEAYTRFINLENQKNRLRKIYIHINCLVASIAHFLVMKDVEPTNVWCDGVFDNLSSWSITCCIYVLRSGFIKTYFILLKPIINWKFQIWISHLSNHVSLSMIFSTMLNVYIYPWDVSFIKYFLFL